MLQTETVTETTLALIKQLMIDEQLQDFYLVGGTALSLQLGHRMSIDIDMFTNKDFDSLYIKSYLEKEYHAEVTFVGKNTFLGFINDVKVDFISHKYKLINPIYSEGGIRMASLEDIAAMKFNAIVQDGSRLKDFVDVCYLLQNLSLNKMLDAYILKYNEVSAEIAKKALLYHDDVDFTVPISFTKGREYNWNDIKEQLEIAVKKAN